MRSNPEPGSALARPRCDFDIARGLCGLEMDVEVGRRRGGGSKREAVLQRVGGRRHRGGVGEFVERLVHEK